MFLRGPVSLVVGSLFVTCMLLALSAGPGAAQTQAMPQPDLSNVPLSLDRIREGVLREQKLNIPFLNPDTPVFRMRVEEGFKLDDYWKGPRETAVSPKVRLPIASTWHNEFLRMTSPNGQPNYPIGPNLLEIGSAIKKAWRNYQLEQIRKQIEDELKQIEENRRRQPERPTTPPPPQ